jgi:hypothetical protein
MGWDQLDNGSLLRAAENEFDAVVTTDKNMRLPTDGDRAAGCDPASANDPMVDCARKSGESRAGQAQPDRV